MVRRSSTVSDAPTRLDEYLSSQEGVKMPTRPLPDVNQGSVPQQGTYPVKTILYSQGLPVARRVLPHRLDTTSLAPNAGAQGNGRVQTPATLVHVPGGESRSDVPRLSLAVPRTSSSLGLSLDAPSTRRGSLESLDCEGVLNEYLRGLRRMLATGKHRVSVSQQDFFESRAERLHESLSRRLGKLISRRSLQHSRRSGRRSRLRDLSPVSIEEELSPRRPPQRVRSSSPLSYRHADTGDVGRDRRSSSHRQAAPNGSSCSAPHHRAHPHWALAKHSVESLPRSTPESSCVGYPLHPGISRGANCPRPTRNACGGAMVAEGSARVDQTKKAKPVIITGFEEFDVIEEPVEKRRESGRVLIGSTEELFGGGVEDQAKDVKEEIDSCQRYPSREGTGMLQSSLAVRVPPARPTVQPSNVADDHAGCYHFTSIEFMDSLKSGVLSRSSAG